MHAHTHPRGLHPSAVDFDETPFVSIWETTRACDLACKHCRAEAISEPLPGELTHDEGRGLLRQIAEMGTPICVLSGGDPAKRPDLFELIRYGKVLGMRMATIPAATSMISRELVKGLKEAGLDQMAMSLDGPTAEVHDTFRGVPGAFDLTMRGARLAAEEELPLQINTVFSSFNWEYFDEIAALVRKLGVVFWEVFFLVPMGRGAALRQMNARQYEELFGRLAAFGHSVDFIVKITEAPQYRRFLIQQRKKERREGEAAGHPGAAAAGKGALPAHMTRDFGPGGSIGLAPKGVNSGNGHLFVSYCGDVYPSGFLPLKCGNVREQPLAEIYREHKVFKELRDPDLLEGKCGYCEYRNICAGSRARAFAMTGNYLAEEPFCDYDPPLPRSTSQSG